MLDLTGALHPLAVIPKVTGPTHIYDIYHIYIYIQYTHQKKKRKEINIAGW